MHLFLIIFLIFTLPTTLVSHPRFSQPPSFGESIILKQVSIDEKCTIVSRVGTPTPYDEDFQWKKDDHWKLVSYPAKIIEVIKSESTAPNWCGGDLLQRWRLKAHEAGTFELIFKRHSESVILTLKVSQP